MKLKHCTAFAAAVCLLFGMTGCAKNEKNKEIRVYSSLLCSPGNPIAENNEIQQIIAEKTGAKCIETWLPDRDSQDGLFSDMIISGQYPDFLFPDSANYQKLVNAGAFIPIDSYWDDYPNVRNYFSDSEWEKIRSEDGHIYVIPPFSNCYLQDTITYHNDEAFWIQVKVLEWDGYPQIESLDEYFDLLERYTAANPVNENGEPYIGYEILANDTYFFGLDNVPMFLDGYPNDGCCIVDADTLTATDFNLSPTAEKWFRKLNEEYHSGLIDPECFVMNIEEYYDKISSGRVLGMVDQFWNFGSRSKSLPSDCTYIPLGITIEKGMSERYHSRTAFDSSSGMGISVSCTDPEGAMQFLNDLLSPEILNLRFWGVEGTDYMVDDNGIFYHTDEQAAQWRDAEYAAQHICLYSYFPYYWGMNQDGINAYCPTNQPGEFYKGLTDDVRRCFDAYGVQTYVEVLDDAPENAPWYPMWSYSGSFTEDSAAGKARDAIEAARHQYLPQLVMSSDFDTAWKDYNTAYAKLDSQTYFDALTEVVRRLSEIG